MRARVTAHKDYVIAAIDDRLYGAFLEHLGRAVYSGIYEPDHPSADSDGMRGDVADLVRALNIPMVRYPGGNFVSAYNWEDGIGPREERPTRLDLAWHTSESNHVGIHEFANWCDTVGTEMMLAVNLGSRGLDAARNFVEYVNHPGGSYWSDLRKKNGQTEPWNCRLWCLGNEMDGPWQIGNKSAAEYGKLANNTAKAIRAFDPSLELVVCGSSNSDMPTYPEWEATVLDQSYDEVDYISLHMYFANTEKDNQRFLGLAQKLDTYIGTVAGIIDYVKAKKRSKRQVYISFDEWNVWYHTREQDKAILHGVDWPHAPPVLEDIYNFEDALQVGAILNTFIRRADVVKIGCIAQLVNVIAPIMTEPGGRTWRQTIYYPYLYASIYGRGEALRLAVDCPTYDTVDVGDVPYIDIAGVRDAAGGTVTFFVVNRHGTESLDLNIALEGFGDARVDMHKMIRHDDLEAVNTADDPDNVAPVDGTNAIIEDGRVKASLPPLSYHLLRVSVG